MDLKQKIKLLPQRPGIYLMKDHLGNIIYIGKAKSLKSRVSQYFHETRQHAPKILDMIRRIDSFDYVETDTELDAFLLECRLIKEQKPKYNKQMKSDKGYVYIKLSMHEAYPRISTVTKKSDKRSVYYGPYTSLNRVENAIHFIKDYFPVRKCSASVPKSQTSGCLNYNLGICFGACRKEADPLQYTAYIERIKAFLEDTDSTPVAALEQKMLEAAERLDFEKAAQYRDMMRGVRHVLNKQRLQRSSQRGRNIAAVELINDSTLKLFLIKGNRLLYSELLSADIMPGAALSEHLKTLFIEKFTHGTNVENVVLSQQDIDEAQIIYSYIKNKKTRITNFWIPSNWLEESCKLTKGVDDIISKIYLDYN